MPEQTPLPISTGPVRNGITGHRGTGGDVLVAINRELLERLFPGVIAEVEATCKFTDPVDRENWLAGALGWAFDRLLERIGKAELEALDPDGEMWGGVRR